LARIERDEKLCVVEITGPSGFMKLHRPRPVKLHKPSPSFKILMGSGQGHFQPSVTMSNTQRVIRFHFPPPT